MGMRRHDSASAWSLNFRENWGKPGVPGFITSLVPDFRSLGRERDLHAATVRDQ